MFRYSVLFVLILNLFIVNGYFFKCLNDCDCDTDDETIHCHNKDDNDRLYMPTNRLRGFRFIGLTNNNIRVLPSEDYILEKFPDLQVIDVEGNENFDCTTIDGYKEIQILNDCGKEKSDLHKTIVPTIGEATQDCDADCQLKRHYNKLHQYVINLYNLIKDKFDEVSKTKIAQDIRQWIDNVMSNFRSKIDDDVNDN